MSYSIEIFQEVHAQTISVSFSSHSLPLGWHYLFTIDFHRSCCCCYHQNGLFTFHVVAFSSHLLFNLMMEKRSNDFNLECSTITTEQNLIWNGKKSTRKICFNKLHLDYSICLSCNSKKVSFFLIPFLSQSVCVYIWTKWTRLYTLRTVWMRHIKMIWIWFEWIFFWSCQIEREKNKNGFR